MFYFESAFSVQLGTKNISALPFGIAHCSLKKLPNAAADNKADDFNLQGI